MTFANEVEKFWNEFRMTRSEIGPATPYQTWYFGNTPEMANELAELVISGQKTATASSVDADGFEPEKAPVLDGYSVVTDFEGRPVCIIRTTEISYVPFGEVDAKFAYDEGEGDRTLESWSDTHWKYFTREAEQYGFEFNERSLVCCERFRLLFP
jgi:uncharacterized protein YhfF